MQRREGRCTNIYIYGFSSSQIYNTTCSARARGRACVINLLSFVFVLSLLFPFFVPRGRFIKRQWNHLLSRALFPIPTFLLRLPSFLPSWHRRRRRRRQMRNVDHHHLDSIIIHLKRWGSRALMRKGCYRSSQIGRTDRRTTYIYNSGQISS